MAFNPNSLNETTIKRFVDKLVQQNKKKDTWPPKRAVVQEDVAVMLGYKNWHELNKSVSMVAPHQTTPNPTELYLPQSSPVDHFGGLSGDYPFERATEHFLIKGSDKKRRGYFDQLLELNPHAHFLFVQGENSLSFVSTKDRPFFNYSRYQYSDVDNATTLPHSLFTSTVCQAIGNLVAYKVGQNQHFDAIQQYVAHILLNTNLGSSFSGLALFFDNAKNDVLKYFSVDPQTMLHSKHISEMTRFWNDHHLVSSTATILAFVLKNLANRTFINALSSPTPSVGIRLYETMDYDLDDLIGFCDIWMRIYPGPKVVVADGIHHNSKLYPALSRNLSAWGEAGTAVFVGAASDADLPNDPKSYQRFVSRIGHVNAV